MSLSLPPEIICYLIEKITDPKIIESLLNVDIQTRELVEDCVKILVGNVNVSLVEQLPNLQYVDGNIILNSFFDITSLATHPQLRDANILINPVTTNMFFSLVLFFIGGYKNINQGRFIIKSGDNKATLGNGKLGFWTEYIPFEMIKDILTIYPKGLHTLFISSVPDNDLSNNMLPIRLEGTENILGYDRINDEYPIIELIAGSTNVKELKIYISDINDYSSISPFRRMRGQSYLKVLDIPFKVKDINTIIPKFPSLEEIGIYDPVENLNNLKVPKKLKQINLYNINNIIRSYQITLQDLTITINEQPLLLYDDSIKWIRNWLNS